MDKLRNIDFSVFFDFWRKFLYFLDCVLNRCNRFDFHCKRQPIGTVINRDFQPAKYFNTANLIPSTLSVTTSFMAVFLTFKRSPFYAFWYAANDVILIVLWSLAVAENISYMSVVVCFVAFFANDIYGFANWKKMARRQTTIQTVV